MGGYWSAGFSVQGSLDEMRWLMKSALGCHVESFARDGAKAWEGFANSLTLTAGGLRVRPMGYDPLCTLISDKDVARASQLAVRRQAAGIFNVSGREAIPLSELARWTGGESWGVPGPLLNGAARAIRRLHIDGPSAALDSAHLRYGFTLDTRKAERELGFRPGYRVGLSLAGDGSMKLETAPF